MLGVIRGGTGAPSGRMRTFPAAAILLVALERFSEDAGILADLIHLQEQQPSKDGLETNNGTVMCAACYLGHDVC